MSNPLILGTNSIKDTGYDVANSLRFNSGDSPYLSKSISTVSSTKKFTFSTWFKRSKLPTSNVNLFGADGGSTRLSQFFFYEGSGQFIRLFDRLSSTTNIDLTTDMLFRDVSSWYHIVVQVDSTQSTQTDRVKMYINGSQVTFNASATALTYPSLNADFNFQNASSTSMYVGSSQTTSGTQYGSYDGYMAETVYLDGQSVDQNSFGEFDSDSPNIWKPIDVSGLTFGNNGFYLEYKQTGTSANSSGIGADTSGNNNHLTVHNLASTDQSIDTCTNNFATFNPLITFPSNPPDLSEGNLKVETIDSDPGHFGGASTIGVSQGKWYFESTSLSSRELVPAGGGTISHAVGIHSDPFEAARQGTSFSPQFTGGIIYALNGKYYSTATGSSGASYGSTYAHNDIIGVAIDLDNHKLYFSKNGTFQNSGDPTSGSTGTGAISIPTGLTYFAFVTDVGGSAVTSSINFGSPINSISSGNSDAEGFGNFEHSVPSGYFSLCSSNLAEYG